MFPNPQAKTNNKEAGIWKATKDGSSSIAVYGDNTYRDKVLNTVLETLKRLESLILNGH